MHTTRRMILVLVVGLIVTACGGDSTDQGTATTEAEPIQPAPTDAPTTTETVVTTTTAAAAGPDGQIPELNVSAALQPYGTEDITQGQVVVYWYRGSNRGIYVALYTGEGIANAAGLKLCPGNSIATDNFYHIPNAPSEDGACEWDPADVGSLQVCDQASGSTRLSFPVISKASSTGASNGHPETPRPD